MDVRSGLAAFGVIGILAIAGCGSGGSGGSGAQPSWAKALGSGVTVTPPGSTSAGDGSPGGVVAKVASDMRAGRYAKFCTALQPSDQATCKSTFSSASASTLASAMPTFKNYVVGYTAIDGDMALVGATGTVCTPNQTPECNTNTDPAAILDSGKSFAALWSQAAASNTNAYSLTPLVKVNGVWYGFTNSP